MRTRARRALFAYELLLFAASVLIVYRLGDWAGVLVSIRSPWVLEPPVIFSVEVMGFYFWVNALNPVTWAAVILYFRPQSRARVNPTDQSQVTVGAASSTSSGENSTGTFQPDGETNQTRKLKKRLRRIVMA